MDEFEWDGVKARSNFAKHGVSFEAAVECSMILSLSNGLILVESQSRLGTSSRAMAKGVLLTVAYTERGYPMRIIRREKPRNMSKKNIIVARPQTDGTLVQVLPGGSARPLEDKTDWAGSGPSAVGV